MRTHAGGAGAGVLLVEHGEREAVLALHAVQRARGRARVAAHGARLVALAVGMSDFAATDLNSKATWFGIQ